MLKEKSVSEIPNAVPRASDVSVRIPQRSLLEERASTD